MQKYIKTKELVMKKKQKPSITKPSDLAKRKLLLSNSIRKDNHVKDTNYETPQADASNQVEEIGVISSYETSSRALSYGKEKLKQSVISKRKQTNNAQINTVKQSSSFKTNTHIKQNKYNVIQPKGINELKHKFKINQNMTARTSKTILNKTIVTIEKTINIIGKTVISINNLISYGICTILLLVLTLFMGVFSSFADNSVYGLTIVPLSDEVIAYTEIIEEYANKYGIEEYVPVIQAIMMHESQGLGDDPMGASSFSYYGECPEELTLSEYSIEVGVHYLSDCIHKANVSASSDNARIYLAIQGYDFEMDYIEWALEHFNGYSKTNAQVYFEEELASNPSFDMNYVNHVMQYIGFGFGIFRLEPNFDNHMAWGNNNPYSRNKLYGQCTWFAWGRFYEIYGYDPGFRGDGWNCAKQLVNAHPDKFELSSSPQVGAIFSCVGRNHVGLVVGWDGTNITIQEGNLDGKSNTFTEAKSDWQTKTYDINTFRRICDGVVFAINKMN